MERLASFKDSENRLTVERLRCTCLLRFSPCYKSGGGWSGKCSETGEVTISLCGMKSSNHRHLLITVGRLGEGCLTGISIFAQNFLAAFAKPLLPAGRFISRNLNKNKMKATGLKLICERADGAITTWHDVFETTVEDVIRKVRHQKRWMGGKFLEAYLEFDNDGKYYKVYLDVKERGFNQLLGS